MTSYKGGPVIQLDSVLDQKYMLLDILGIGYNCINYTASKMNNDSCEVKVITLYNTA